MMTALALDKNLLVYIQEADENDSGLALRVFEVIISTGIIKVMTGSIPMESPII